MATWQPPIPSGALYSAAATALGPGLALLAWCYDRVERDGCVQVFLEKAAADIGKPYGTVRDWWKDMKGSEEKPSPFFSDITPQGRKGWRVKFKTKWIDWRIVERDYPERRDFSGENEDTAEIPAVKPGEPKTSDEDTNDEVLSDFSSLFDRRDISDQTSGNKVLMITDQATVSGALNAPRKTPAKGRNRDPNQQHPACLLFFEKTGYRPNRQQAADIASIVIDIDLWAKAMAAWLGKGNRTNDANGMLDWYKYPARFAPKEYPNGSQAQGGSVVRRNGQGPANAYFPSGPVSAAQAELERSYRESEDSDV